MVLVVKNLPASAGNVRDVVQSLGWEDPLEEGMVTHSSILAWKISMDREAWRATVHRVTERWTWLKQLNTHAYGEQSGYGS